ncbi:unnamed protein product [Nippostrongylus brasiliensis]|uniref:Uncharacterized protein n=1 Tax=Nippostrongylus brasiliensis TaxID=27835 RepID=A0A0N4Y802_NIPBR|nr:unnamed protein product [Nippostrongylus brasiliensis]
MAFGGLLDGFLAEKNFEGSSRGRRGLHTMNPRRSLTMRFQIGMENDKMAVKKISTVSAPMHKYSWPLARGCWVPIGHRRLILRPESF